MEKITVYNFCRKKTKAQELCVIRQNGWIVATAWIDYEDLFMLPKHLIDKPVVSDEWGTLNIVGERGEIVNIPCHYIDIKC